MALPQGKQFEKDIATSCEKQSIYLLRLRDIYIPPELRHLIDVPRNKYDYLLYHDTILMPLELKSSQAKSVPFGMIEEHQINALAKADTYHGVYPGFIFNFRNANRTYYVHIRDFLNYQSVAAGETPSPYKHSHNQKSIPMDICAEVGIEINCQKLKVHYRYDMKGLVSDIKDKYIKGDTHA